MTVDIVSATLPETLVRPILDAAQSEDGVAAFSEAFERGLFDDTLNHTHLIAKTGDKTVAVAGIAEDGSTELAVHPEHRRHGYGRALVQGVLERNADAGFWAHGDLPAAQALARDLGMEPVRELLVMGTALDPEVTPEVREGYELVQYPELVSRWGREVVDKQWLEVNNDAFSWHPEQGGWDIAQLHRAMDTDWFDADGVWFLVAGDEIAGFHWTKRHPDGTGEIYVVGLSSKHRGEGMGGPLIQAGLNYLAECGSSQVILYVEGDNEPAVKRYRQLGFDTRERHVVYKPASKK